MAKENLEYKLSSSGGEQVEADIKKISAAEKQATADSDEMSKSVEKSEGKLFDASNAADKFVKDLAGMAAGAITLQALLAVIKEIAAALELASEKQAELTRGAVSNNKEVAGAAKQFDVREEIARQEFQRIGIMSGVDDSGIGNLADLAVTFSSEGLIGTMTDGRFSDSDTRDISTTATWLESGGAGAVSSQVVQAIARIKQGNPNLSIAEILGLLESGFKNSPADTWSNYLSGLQPVYGQIAQGLDAGDTFALHAAMMTVSGGSQGASSDIRRVGETSIFSGREKFIKTYDSVYGDGEYDRQMQAADRTGVLHRTLDMFEGYAIGSERGSMYKASAIEPTQGAIIDKMITQRAAKYSDMREKIQPFDISGANAEWLTQSRAALQSAQMKASTITDLQGDANPEWAAVREVVNAQIEKEIASENWLAGIKRAFVHKTIERRDAARRLLAPVYKKHGISWYDLQDRQGMALTQEDDFSFSHVEDDGLRTDMRASIGLGPATIINGGTHYHTGDKVDPAGQAQPMKGVE